MNSSFYKGFNINKTDKRSKLRNEYFNPYGYNLSACTKDDEDLISKCTHTDQNSRVKW